MTAIMVATATCEWCQEESPDTQLTVSDERVCADCVTRFYHVCDDCQRPASQVLITVDGESVCEGCGDEYSSCDECGKLTSDGELTTDEDVVCEGCARNEFTECDACNRYARSTGRTDGGSDLCEGCQTYYWWCQDCEEILIDSGEYCESCAPEHGDEYCDAIHDYGHKPHPQFHGRGPVYLGWELEITVPYGMLTQAAYEADDTVGSVAYLKEDTSIGHGFELVTHPMSYEWAMELFPWQVLDKLSRMGADGYGNGLHVHVNRTAFAGPCHMYRWMKFIHRNQCGVTGIARRDSDEWAAFTASGREDVKHAAKGDRTGTRYQAINTLNRETLEVRVFAASLKPQEVQAALGLVAASVEYTRTLTAQDVARRAGWEWSPFVTWVRERPEYAPLLREMEAQTCAC